MMNMKICKRLFLVGMALGLVLAGCDGTGEEVAKSNEAAITVLTLSIGGVEETIDFGTGKTANIELSESTTPNMPASATVKSVILSEGASGLKDGDEVPIDATDATNGVASITITAEDGVTTGIYTVTVTIGAKLNLNTVDLSYTEVTATAGTANDTGVAPAWTGSPTPTGITYSIDAYTATAESGADGSIGDSPVVAIDADGKITITAGAEVVNSGIYTVTATAGEFSNYLKGSTKTFDVTVSIAARSEAAIAALTLAIGDVEKTIDFGTGKTANIELSESTTPNMPASATVKSVILSEGASGLKDGDVVAIDTAEGMAIITITAEDGVTTGIYTVTVTIGAKRNLNTVDLSYTEVTATAGTANDTGVAPAWTGSPTPTGITYSITAYTGDTNGADGSIGDSPVVAIDADGKITITAGAEAENSGTYTVTATAGANSNYADTTTQTATVTVSIAKRNLNTVDLSYTEVTATAGTADVDGVAPVWTGSPTPTGITYSIDAYTATAGSGADGSIGDSPVVAIDADGKITITADAEVVNSGTYTVTATADTTSNYLESSTQTAPVTVRIINNEATITELTLVIDGVDYPITFGTDKTAEVELPEGTFIPETATVQAVNLSTGASGLVHGGIVNIDAYGEASITITITAEDGVTKGIYTVTVKGMQALDDYSLSYPMAKRSADGSISVSPVWKKGAVDAIPGAGGVSYAIDPALPTGLALDTNSGIISGTMPSLDKVTAYQITATGNGTDYVNTATGTFLDKFVSEETYTQDTSGTAISNIAELQAMTQTLDGEYYLTAHIDLTGETWTPIASSASPFTGTLHGNGYAIYNLTIAAETETYQGLFASVSGATVENLGIGVTSIKGKAAVGALAGAAETATLSNIAVAPMVADAKIEAFGSAGILRGGTTVEIGAHLGGAVGYQENGSLSGYSLVSVHGYDADAGDNIGGFLGYGTGVAVSGYATGDVTGQSSESIGGLVGVLSKSTINDSYATGDVTATGSHVGGLVGLGNLNASINNSYATGNVSGKSYVGGLAGRAHANTISGYATGDVTATTTLAGGLVGESNRSTTIGYATGDVTGNNYTGGLVGRIYSSFIKGYATGDVSGSDKVGGLIGGITIGSTTTKSSVGYATGVVTGTTNVGGFIGLADSTYGGPITGYWDKTSTGQDTSAGGAVGISQTQNIVFASANSYTDSGNSNSTIFELTDFIDIFDTTNGADKTWPKLKSDSFALIQPTVSDLDDDGTIEVVY